MAVTNVGAASVKQEVKEFKGSSMDKDAFLNLLVTQLKNQNPLEPMKDTEFISQMAQFSSLEQSQNMNKTIKLDSAYNMVNKLVKATHKDEEGEVEDIIGVVSMVRVDNDKILLKVDGVEVTLDEIKEVTDTISPYEQMQTINQNFRMSSAFGLIGKDVKAKIADSTGKSFEEVAGIVESVRIDNGSIYVQVNEKEIPVESIYFVK
jgi:flagellar basal-body rod modification protein FlgD